LDTGVLLGVILPQGGLFFIRAGLTALNTLYVDVKKTVNLAPLTRLTALQSLGLTKNRI